MAALYDLTVSVIIPVYNGGEKFRRCLNSIKSLRTPPTEVIVVADGDSDGSWKLAEEFGVRLLRRQVAGGPALARNFGAQHAKGDILFFIDADVTVHDDVVEKVLEAFQNVPDLAAVIGSYDDQPFEKNFLSQYRNLLHHYVHQTSNIEASTFWGACGAIRRNLFLETGGFDNRYHCPSIEDIDLGYRLKKQGYKIHLLKYLQVKHLKHWGIVSLLKADFFCRALPWTDLILREGQMMNDLNLKRSSRVSVMSVMLLPIMFIGATFQPMLSIPALLLMLSLLILNWDLYRFFKVKRGFAFALKTIPWHWLYFFYSGLAFAVGYVLFQIKRFKVKGNL